MIQLEFPDHVSLYNNFKACLGIFIYLLPAGINNQDKSSTLPKWPWFTSNNNKYQHTHTHTHRRTDIVLHISQKRIRCDWSYFLKWRREEGCFPSYLKSYHVPLTAGTAVHFSGAYVMKCFWRKELLFSKSISCPGRMGLQP